ncbi:hypothetical protein C2G38_2115077 [Gigaspora rosea]|uniref:Uncharacterized protein n=1 Tax=Gigaspora rosea TaxID=44941 RepID=A0A397U9M5_9GLOM|nr:hypothetical protein C2G38_2115077 [Gigaspora rosea]
MFIMFIMCDILYLIFISMIYFFLFFTPFFALTRFFLSIGSDSYFIFFFHGLNRNFLKDTPLKFMILLVWLTFNETVRQRLGIQVCDTLCIYTRFYLII